MKKEKTSVEPQTRVKPQTTIYRPPQQYKPGDQYTPGGRYKPSSEVEMPMEMYKEYVMRGHKEFLYFKKLKQTFLQEPESEARSIKLEIITKVIARLQDTVNWWDRYEWKLIREKKAEHLKRQKKEFDRRQKEWLEKQSKPYEQEFNYGCRYYYQANDERKCRCGMDMCFCGSNCAFATNAIGSTKVYNEPYLNRYGHRDY